MLISYKNTNNLSECELALLRLSIPLASIWVIRNELKWTNKCFIANTWNISKHATSH